MIETLIVVCLAAIFYVVLRRMPEVEKIEVEKAKKDDSGVIETIQKFVDKITRQRSKKQNKVEETTKKVKVKDLFNAAQKKQIKGDLDGAEKIYLKLATLKPRSAEVFEALGDIYYKRKDYNDAVLAYKAALNRDRENGFYYYNLAMSLYKLKKNNEAKTCFEKSIAHNNKIGIRHVGLGMCLLRLGDADNAVKSFEKAIEIEPNNEKYKNLLRQARFNHRVKKKLKKIS